MELKAGLPRAKSPSRNKQGPSRRWFQGNLVGTFFPGTKIDGMYLQGQLSLCCPRAGTQKPIGVGATLLLCALLQGLES